MTKVCSRVCGLIAASGLLLACSTASRVPELATEADVRGCVALGMVEGHSLASPRLREGCDCAHKDLRTGTREAAIVRLRAAVSAVLGNAFVITNERTASSFATHQELCCFVTDIVVTGQAYSCQSPLAPGGPRPSLPR